MIVLGGKDAYKTWASGQFGCALQHVDDQPSLVIWPLRVQPGAGAFVLGVKAIHRYFDEPFERGCPSRYGMMSVMQALDVMKIGATDRAAAIAMMDIIYRYSDDLVRMPPDLRPREVPKAIQKTLDSVELLANGETVASVAH